MKDHIVIFCGESETHYVAWKAINIFNLLYAMCTKLVYLFSTSNVTKDPVTQGLRPGYDLPATEKWANRRKNVRLIAEVVRLVAEVVGDRKGQISRSKVVVMFKTQSHRAYDQVTTYLRSKNVAIVERTYD